MPALDVEKSAFSKAERIDIYSPSLDSSWREHVVGRIASLSKIATVAVALTFSAAPCLSQTSTPSQQPSASQEQLDWAQDFRRQIDAKERRQEAIIELYFNKLKEGKFLDSWEAMRPDLKIFTRFSGHDFSQRATLADHAGMAKEDFSSKSTSLIVGGLDKEINAISTSQSAPAVSVIMSNALFRPVSQPQGSLCMVSVNVHIVEAHNELQKLTGWPDDVMADFVVRHEMTHCIEQNDRHSRLAKEIVSRDIRFGDLASSQTLENLKKSAESHKNEVITSVSHPDDKKRMKLLNAMRSSFSDSAASNGEEISDALSLLSLIKEGVLDTSSIDNLCNARRYSRFRGEKHNTAKFLYAIKDDLERNPEVVSSWRKNHASETAAGKKLQIDDLLAWLTPKWLNHVNEKDSVSKKKEKALSSLKSKADHDGHNHNDSVSSVLQMLDGRPNSSSSAKPKIRP